MTDDAFFEALSLLHNASGRDNICAPFELILPGTGVAISTLGDPFGVQTVYASNVDAAHLDEIQLDLGEGPGWEAFHSRAPVLEPNLFRATVTQWPMALHEMQAAGVAAAHAFPMHIGSLNIGVVNLYNRTPTALSDRLLRHVTALAEGAARHVLRKALRHAQEDGDGTREGDARWYSQRELHQASGMLIAQTGLPIDDAILILRGYAFATGRTVRALAADITARRIDFTNYTGTAPTGESSRDSDS